MSEFSPFAPEPRGNGGESRFDWMLLVIIAVNLFPLVMAFQGRFDGNELLIAYWLELLVVGVVVLAKMITAVYPSDLPPLVAPITAALFTISYSAGCVLLGRLVFLLVGRDPDASVMVLLNPFGQSELITIWLLMLCLCHGLPLVTRWFLRGERKGASAIAESLAAYGRMILLLATIILGTLLGVCFELNRNMAFSLGPLCALVAGKITFDLLAHRAGRQRMTRRAACLANPAPPRYAPLPDEANDDE